MKKTIYKKDIKAIVKKFGLDEFEAREVEIFRLRIVLQGT